MLWYLAVVILYKKFLYYHSTRVACGALENLIGRSVENMASHLPAKHIT